MRAFNYDRKPSGNISLPTPSAAIRSWERRTRLRKNWHRLPSAGVRGIAVSFVNFLEELPYFCDEVLPRLVRKAVLVENSNSHVLMM